MYSREFLTGQSLVVSANAKGLVDVAYGRLWTAIDKVCR